MVDWVIRAAQDAGVGRVVVVASPDTAALYTGLEVAVQAKALGTGDAVRSARDALAGEAGDVLVLNGDVPALRPETLRALLDTHAAAAAAGTVLSFEPDDRRRYGRIVRDDAGLARIVEAGDASPEELALREVNSGIYVFRAEKLWPALDRLEPHNVQGELYVTDTIGLLVGDGDRVAVHVADGSVRGRGDQHPRRARRGRRRAPRPRQRRPYARRRDDRRPRLDLDRGRRRDRAGRHDPSVHRDPRRRPDRVAASRSARSRTSGRERPSARRRRSAPSSR